MTHRRATLLLIITSILWSLGGVLLQSVTLHSMVKAGYRCAFAVVVLLWWLRPVRLVFTGRQVAIAIAYAATLTLFVLANDLTTAANAIFLQYTAPIYVALAGYWLLGERTRGWDWFFIVIALAGIALFFRDGFEGGRWVGDLVALASGVCFAAMVMLLRRERHGSPESAVLLGNIVGVLVALPWLLRAVPSAKDFALLGTLGVVQIAIPYLIYVRAIRHVTAIEAVLIPALEPILNPVWVALVHGQKPGPWALAGAALVLVAVLGRGLLLRPAQAEK
jgi:drug/metabolite transporter (DMT)-like permease